MIFLIFDYKITGHHSEYINHLVDFIYRNNNINDNYYFIVHPDFCKKFPDIVNKVPQPKVNFITITYSELDDLYIRKFDNLKNGIDSFKIYRLLIKYTETIKPDKCILMYFNVFAKALIARRPKFKIYGIYFHPFTRTKASHNFNFILKYIKNRGLTFLYTRNNKIEKIFVLNDKKTVGVLNKQNLKNIFYYLPDPIPISEEEPGFDIRRKYNIDEHKKILLHFGSLRHSKGTIELIQSLNFLSKEVASKCCLIISGKPFDEEIKKLIQKNISKIRRVKIVYIDYFVSNAQMKSFFNQSDLIMMPYKNHMASSGILGHAIASEKPVISTKHGLIGELIKTEWMGELIDTIQPKSIAKAIEKSIVTDYPLINNKNFLKEHTPYNFAKTILEQS